MSDLEELLLSLCQELFVHSFRLTTRRTCPTFDFVRSLSSFLFLRSVEDSDSESETSSEDEVTQNGSSSGGRRTTGGPGPAGGQKRHRKKRGVAIPVATPKVPTLPPTTAPPRLPQQLPDLEKGEISMEMVLSEADDQIEAV